MAEKKDDKEKNGWAVMDGDGVIEDFWRHIFFSLPIDVFHRYGSSRVIYRETHGFSQNSWWVVSTSSPRSKKSLTFQGETVVYQWNIMSLLGCVAIPICWYCCWLVDGTWWY
jgi:hypothetical protein